MMQRRGMRLQTSIEYLMANAWALIIIAVVLVSFLFLGLFSTTTASSACIGSQGVSCANPVISTNGLLSLTFTQSTGSTLYNVEIACDATENSIGQPSAPGAYGFIERGGASISTINALTLSNALNLNSSQSVAISGIVCYKSSGSPIPAGSSIGTPFTGYIFMNYTKSACGSLPCGWLSLKVGTITAKVT